MRTGAIVFRKVYNKISSQKKRLDRLLELLLDDSIDKSEYDEKRKDLLAELETAELEQRELSSTVKNDTQLKKRLTEFKAMLERSEEMKEFDPVTFEDIIEKIVIGAIDEQGIKNPNKITFVFKSGLTTDANAPTTKAGRPRKKGSEDGVIDNVEISGSLCSQESGHTVVLFGNI